LKTRHFSGISPRRHGDTEIFFDLSPWLTAAVAGLLAGASACDDKPSTAATSADGAQPAAAATTEGSATTSEAAKQGADCCAGKNDCKGKGGCATDATKCAGKNDCKGKGGCKHRECS
jgi:hypothetical protein